MVTAPVPMANVDSSTTATSDTNDSIHTGTDAPFVNKQQFQPTPTTPGHFGTEQGPSPSSTGIKLEQDHPITPESSTLYTTITTSKHAAITLSSSISSSKMGGTKRATHPGHQTAFFHQNFTDLGAIADNHRLVLMKGGDTRRLTFSESLGDWPLVGEDGSQEGQSTPVCVTVGLEAETDLFFAGHSSDSSSSHDRMKGFDEVRRMTLEEESDPIPPLPPTTGKNDSRVSLNLSPNTIMLRRASRSRLQLELAPEPPETIDGSGLVLVRTEKGEIRYVMVKGPNGRVTTHVNVNKQFAIGSRGMYAHSAPYPPERALLNESHSNLIELGKLGHGSGGEVVKAIHMPTMRFVAIKKVAIDDGTKLTQAISELEHLKCNLLHIREPRMNESAYLSPQLSPVNCAAASNGSTKTECK